MRKTKLFRNWYVQFLKKLNITILRFELYEQLKQVLFIGSQAYLGYSTLSEVLKVKITTNNELCLTQYVKILSLNIAVVIQYMS